MKIHKREQIRLQLLPSDEALVTSLSIQIHKEFDKVAGQNLKIALGWKDYNFFSVIKSLYDARYHPALVYVGNPFLKMIKKNNDPE